jgi:hypothetical protein
MKQNVLERADAQPRKKKAHRRVGIGIALVALIAVGTASGAVALGLAPQPFTQQAPIAAPSATTKPPSEPPATAPFSPSPKPTPTSGPSATSGRYGDGFDWIASCKDLVPAEEYDRLFGATPLAQGGSKITVPGTIPVPDYTGVVEFERRAEYLCAWAYPSADVSGLGVRIGHATAAEIDAREQDLSAHGGTCSERDNGRVCQQTVPNEEYPVDTTTTFYVRGDVYIDIHQTNFPTNGLLDAIVQQIWETGYDWE